MAMVSMLQFVQDTWQHAVVLATSKALRRNVIRSVLVLGTAIVQIGFAVASYVVFYNRFLPDQVATIPAHLQYGYEDNPFALAPIAPYVLKSDQAYDVLVTLNMPPSPVNQARGNFMMTLHLVDAHMTHGHSCRSNTGRPTKEAFLEETEVLGTFRRPAIMPYIDPIVMFASRLFWLPLKTLRMYPETVILAISMAEHAPLSTESGGMPDALFLEIEAGQSLQVYSASITLTTQLGGLRWIMHRFWFASFLVITLLFWGIEVFFTIVAFVLLGHIFEHNASKMQSDNDVLVKEEDDDIDGKSKESGRPLRRGSESGGMLS